MKKTGKVIVISGPSGVGKSSIVRAVMERLRDVYLSVSVTTRPQTPQDVAGRDYTFVTRAAFEQQLHAGCFLEHAEVFGNYYGTPKDPLDASLAAGKKVLLEIDVQGGKQVKLAYPDAVMIFILPPDQKVLAGRLDGRGRDDPETRDRRLAEAGHEIATAWQYYNHMVINDDLELAIQEVIQIIQE